MTRFLRWAAAALLLFGVGAFLYEPDTHPAVVPDADLSVTEAPDLEVDEASPAQLVLPIAAVAPTPASPIARARLAPAPVAVAAVASSVTPMQLPAAGIFAELAAVARSGNLENEAQIWGWLSSLHLQAGDADAALRCAMQALRVGDDPTALEGLPADVRLPVLERLVAEEPEPWALAALAQTYSELERTEDLKALYLSALAEDIGNWDWCADIAALDPAGTMQVLAGRVGDDADLLSVLADLSSRSEQPAMAAHYLERGFRVDPETFAERLVAADPKLGASLLARVVDEKRNPGLWGLLGNAYGVQGRNDLAAGAFVQGYLLKPNEAWLATIQRLDPRAVQHIYSLAAAGQSEAMDDEAWGDLGDQFASSGSPARAIDCYQRALTLDDDDGEWPPKIARLQGKPVSQEEEAQEEAFSPVSVDVNGGRHVESSGTFTFEELEVDMPPADLRELERLIERVR